MAGLFFCHYSDKAICTVDFFDKVFGLLLLQVRRHDDAWEQDILPGSQQR